VYGEGELKGVRLVIDRYISVCYSMVEGKSLVARPL
jgi:hypothetical protein